MAEKINRRLHKELTGRVVSDKMQKTVVVEVSRRVMHPKYQKYITLKKKYHVHDEEKKAKTGDQISIVESRPLSKLKHWRLKEVVSKARV